MPLATPRLVVGAIVVDDLDAPSRVLAARRTSPAELAGLWEFPGGKAEESETPHEALVREIHEELEVTVEIGPEHPHPSGAWPISEKYELRLYFASVRDGTLTPGDSHDELKWLAPEALGDVEWLPSDSVAINSIHARLETWGT